MPVSRLVVLSAVILAAFAVRVWRLWQPELSGDEAFSYFMIIEPIGAIVTNTLALREPHPVGSYLFQKALFLLFGRSEFALRYSSVMAGLVAVALAYRLAALLRLPWLSRLTAMILLGLSAFATQHARELRMYSLLLMLTLAMLVAAAHFLRSGSLHVLAGYGVSAWLAWHTHYYAVATILAANAFAPLALLAQPAPHRKLRLWGIAQVAVLLAYAPWLWVARDALVGYEGNASFFDLRAVLVRSFGALIAGGDLAMERGEAYPLAAFIGAALCALQLWRTRHRSALAVLGVAVAAPIALVALSALTRPLFRERYFIAALGPFCVLLGGGLGLMVQGRRPWQKWLGFTLIGVLVTTMADATRIAFQRWLEQPPDWQRLATFIERHSQSLPPTSVRIGVNFPNPAFWYYYTGPIRAVAIPAWSNDEAAAIDQAQKWASQGVKRVVFQEVDSSWDQNRVARSALDRHFTLLHEERLGVWTVGVYGRRSREELQQAGLTFSHTVRLERAAVFLDLPARLVEVALEWRGDARHLRGSEKLFIHVVRAGDPADKLAQRDPFFTAEDLSGAVRLFGVRLPDVVPSGNYEVRLGIYDPGLEGAPRWFTEHGSSDVVLARFAAP